MDSKFEGDYVYVIGETFSELGGSEYFAFLGSAGNTVPKLNSAKALIRYKKLTAAITKEILASAYPINHGGLGIALAKVAIASQIGMELTLPSGLRPDYFLFSESLGRFVVTVSPDNRKDFEDIMGDDAMMLGTVCGTNLRITVQKTIINLPVKELETAYKSPFLGY
jgi:phosphoribosylformylglycinamidine (FGAM) synthase-like enzyme